MLSAGPARSVSRSIETLHMGRETAGGGGRRVRRLPPSRRSQAQAVRTLVLNAERLEGGSIWPPGHLQIVLVLECPQRSGSLRPHATVNRQLGAIGIECCLDAHDKLVVRRWLRRGGWCSRLWRRRSRSRRWRCGGGLALTRCAASECNRNHDSRSHAKLALSCNHEGRPFRCTQNHCSRPLPDQAKRGRSVAKNERLRRPLPRFGNRDSAPNQWPCRRSGSTVRGVTFRRSP